jgi:hypothetical protein
MPNRLLFPSLLLLGCWSIFALPQAWAQVRPGRNGAASPFKEVVLLADTAVYTWTKNTVVHQVGKKLYFRYERPDQVAEIRVYPANLEQLESISLIKSADFTIIDSLRFTGEFFRAKLRFADLAQSQFLAVNFLAYYTDPAGTELRESVLSVPLFPYQLTVAKLRAADNEIYIGEEAVYELEVNQPLNIRADNLWTEGRLIDYKITERDGRIRVHLLPNQLGSQPVQLRLSTKQPFLDANHQPTYQLPELDYFFTVKPGRLAFLKLERLDIVLDEAQGAGLEVELASHRNLQIKKTYRIEDQEAPGGRFIGEIFTRTKLNNGRTLCTIRLYALHRKTDGYLYLKDGDEAVFVTNTDIIPRTSITRVSVSHDGAEWTDNLSVLPGDSLDLRIEGKSLDKAQFYLDGLREAVADSVIRGENLWVFHLRIPPTLAKRRIALFNQQANTGYALTVREYQRPRPLDFVRVNYGLGDLPITSLKNLVFYDQVINDIGISFDHDAIDEANKFYGKQYLELEVRITSNAGQLLELRRVDNLCACPSDTSPRSAFYDRKDCTVGTFQVNNLIGRKTRDLDDWARIELTIRHRADRYGGAGESQRVEIVLQRHVSFDIDVSFPGGLIVKKIGEPFFGGLGGISLAMIAQFRFFQPGKVAALRPYRIGAGFLALNAFNFSANNVNRDLGVVALGTIYPIRRDRKLTFPLFAGFGYLISQKKWFFVLGPGVSVQL